MGFFSSLGKGFIRSAVNQVGRDMGRTVSNQVFNNRNYTPVGMVTNTHQPQPSTKIIMTGAQSGQWQQCIPSDAVLEHPRFPVWQLVLCFGLSILYVGGPLLVFLGWMRSNKQTQKVKWIEYETYRTRDRRTRTGYRGGKIPVSKSAEVQATQEAIKEYKNDGKIMMIVGIVLFVFMVAATIIIRLLH